MLIKASAYIEKANALGEGEVEFVVSTNAIDAHGEKMNVDGIDVSDYLKNPVVLWGHDGFNLPIAKATKVWKEGGKLMARAKFYLKDEFARKVYDYIVDGYLNAVSIGGMVQEWGDDGITIAKLLMKEFSVVSVPANQEALVASKSFSGDQRAELNALANAYARKLLSQGPGGQSQLKKDVEVLDSLVTTLKGLVIDETKEASVDEDISITRRVVLRQAQAVDQQVETVIRRIKLKGEDNNE